MNMWFLIHIPVIIILYIMLHLILGIDCGPLDAPDNGAVNFVTSNVESIARYQCNSGFVLVGENTRTCLLSGVWSDSDPICQGKIDHYESSI